MLRHLIRNLLFALPALFAVCSAVHALTADEARAMAVGDSQERAAAIGKALVTADRSEEHTSELQSQR